MLRTVHKGYSCQNRDVDVEELKAHPLICSKALLYFFLTSLRHQHNKQH